MTWSTLHWRRGGFIIASDLTLDGFNFQTCWFHRLYHRSGLLQIPKFVFPATCQMSNERQSNHKYVPVMNIVVFSVHTWQYDVYDVCDTCYWCMIVLQNKHHQTTVRTMISSLSMNINHNPAVRPILFNNKHFHSELIQIHCIG